MKQAVEGKTIPVVIVATTDEIDVLRLDARGFDGRRAAAVPAVGVSPGPGCDALDAVRW
jgi:hypothetical protein